MNERVIQTENEEKQLPPALKWLVGHIWQIVFGTVIAIWCVAYVSFFCWALISSFKSPVGFYLDPVGIPLKEVYWQPENYELAFKACKKMVGEEMVYFPMLLVNSLLYCAGNALFPNIMLCVTTYVVNKYKHFHWTQVLWVIFLITNYVPFNSDLGSELKLLRSLGIFDSIPGNWLYNCGAFGAGFLMYLGCWRSISNTYMEAAEIDGAGFITTFFRIMFPQTVGLFLVLFLTKFSGMFDDYMPMLIYLPSFPTIASGAFTFQFSSEPGASDVTAKLAGLFLLSLPMMVMYFLMRTKIVKAMSMAGGLKG